MKTLTLKNYHLVEAPHLNAVSFQQWLSSQMLHGAASRMRTRFLQGMAPRVKESDEVRLDLLKKYATKKKSETKDENGKKSTVDLPVMLDKEGKETTDPNVGKRYKIDPEKTEEFNKEYQAYLDENYVIDVTPANREAVYGVRDILLKSEEEFGGRMALLYDEWCKAFEDISESDDKKEKEPEKKKEDL